MDGGNGKYPPTTCLEDTTVNEFDGVAIVTQAINGESKAPQVLILLFSSKFIGHLACNRNNILSGDQCSLMLTASVFRSVVTICMTPEREHLTDGPTASATVVPMITTLTPAASAACRPWQTVG